MCGIVGIVDYRNNDIKPILSKMVDSINHRGPDDKGIEIFDKINSSIGFGHVRLSIIDLSKAGHQPMEYKNLTLSYNGEIYNYLDIKSELISLGHNFKSNTDTEVILHAFQEWGAKCVNKFIGMFSFSIFDKKNLELTLVRDRAGVKPLYYYLENDLFMFSSELKAFHKHPNFRKVINTNSIVEYMNKSFITGPKSIFKSCYKLNGGHYATFNIENKRFKVEKYWDVRDYYSLPSLKIDYIDAKEELKKLMISAFNYRTVSDRKVGVFLSGGYDSTAVTAMLQSNMTNKLRTFTLGFNEGNNEAPHAKRIANYIGTDHKEYYCTKNDAEEILFSLPYYYDEPFADSSAIPTMLISKMAKNDVTVVLSADAGDEVFSGYDHYQKYLKNIELVKMIPEFSRKKLGVMIGIIGRTTKNYKLQKKYNILSTILQGDNKSIAHILYDSYFNLGSEINSRLFKRKFLEGYSDNEFPPHNLKDDLSFALANDYQSFLQDDILTKVDRATMSVSIEGREPLLDQRILEYVAQLPSNYKLGSTTKMILKDVVHDYVPRNLLNRKKSGFEVPIDFWLRGELSYVLDEILQPRNMKNLEFFNESFVKKLVSDYKSNKLKDYTIIWRLVQFKMWYDKWM